MKITRTSPLTGEKATKEINVTPAQISAWEGGELAQSAFPDADSDEREFIMTGYTDYDWNAMFGEIDDES
jgi:hypothetical protein